jgi:hypothetical protein
VALDQPFRQQHETEDLLRTLEKAARPMEGILVVEEDNRL